MKAAIYEKFRGPVEVTGLPDPEPGNNGIVLRVMATGICRSDWHGWMGHDVDITLPHVPGHEMSGIVEEAGSGVTKWRPGDRVTLPFVCGCGDCGQCKTGNQQICDNQTQPGFTHWGSYAEFVSIRHADINLVRLPDEMDFATAASLGCRFATSYRAIVAQGRLEPGQWVAVHGCGGVGLSAIMIAAACDARVVAIDINEDSLALAGSIGAVHTINATNHDRIVDRIHDISGGGVHLSVDALGSAETCINSIACLRKRGRHVQVGLLAGDDFRPRLPMELVIAKELELYGSHGMQAHRYDEMLGLIISGKMDPSLLVGQTTSLEDAARALEEPDSIQVPGISVIDEFGGS